VDEKLGCRAIKQIYGRPEQNYYLLLPPSHNIGIFRFGQSQIYSTLTINILMNELF